MRSHKITQNSQSINLDIQTRLIVQLNQQAERSVPMDENIKNWLHYGERSITSKDVRSDCLLFGLFSLCYDLFRYNKLTITLTDLLLLSGILFTGMKARGKTATKEVFLFKGLCGMCMTYRFYSLSLLFSTLSGANPVHCALLYGAIFLMITFLLFRYLKKRDRCKRLCCRISHTHENGPAHRSHAGNLPQPPALSEYHPGWCNEPACHRFPFRRNDVSIQYELCIEIPSHDQI